MLNIHFRLTYLFILELLFCFILCVYVCVCAMYVQVSAEIRRLQSPWSRIGGKL